jgi:hypothetical protein
MVLAGHVQEPACRLPGVDSRAASPIVVIATFVLVAVGITSLVVFLIVDTTAPLLELQEVREGGPDAMQFRVVDSAGGISWGNLQVQFLDRGGFDRATDYLSVPTGKVAEGDAITLREGLPGGTYVLRVLLEGEELVRLSVTV